MFQLSHKHNIFKQETKQNLNNKKIINCNIAHIIPWFNCSRCRNFCKLFAHSSTNIASGHNTVIIKSQGKKERMMKNESESMEEEQDLSPETTVSDFWLLLFFSTNHVTTRTTNAVATIVELKTAVWSVHQWQTVVSGLLFSRVFSPSLFSHVTQTLIYNGQMTKPCSNVWHGKPCNKITIIESTDHLLTQSMDIQLTVPWFLLNKYRHDGKKQ